MTYELMVDDSFKLLEQIENELKDLEKFIGTIDDVHEKQMMMRLRDELLITRNEAKEECDIISNECYE